MSICRGHMCTFIPNIKSLSLSLILWLGKLCTDADNVRANDTNNYARRINHDYIGLFGIIPNEPKRQSFKSKE